jgi:hypothetical protein
VKWQGILVAEEPRMYSSLVQQLRSCVMHAMALPVRNLLAAACSCHVVFPAFCRQESKSTLVCAGADMLGCAGVTCVTCVPAAWQGKASGGGATRGSSSSRGKWRESINTLPAGRGGRLRVAHRDNMTRMGWPRHQRLSCCIAAPAASCRLCQ